VLDIFGVEDLAGDGDDDSPATKARRERLRRDTGHEFTICSRRSSPAIFLRCLLNSLP